MTINNVLEIYKCFYSSIQKNQRLEFEWLLREHVPKVLVQLGNILQVSHIFVITDREVTNVLRCLKISLFEESRHGCILFL